MTTMTDSKAADVLAAHNEWRRGGDGPQTEPVTLGLALERAIARLREPAGVGEEWVLVPREPSAGMWDSAENAMIESECAYNAGEQAARSDAHGFPTMRIWHAVVGYRAMLAAAPKPPAEAQAQGGGEVEPDGYTSYGEFRWACDCDARQRREWTPVYLAPPSAPVGVEGLQRWSMARGSVYIDHDPEGEWVKWSDVQLAGLTTALAQQPAAVDGACGDACAHIAIERDMLKANTERLAEALRVIEGFTMSQFPDAADMAGACVETAHNALHPTAAQEDGRD